MNTNDNFSVKEVLRSFEKYHIVILVLFAMLCAIPGLVRIHEVIRGWDGTDLGSISLNYYHNGFNFFYPQIDWGGAGPGYVEMQFPLVPFITALLYLVFGIHNQLALVVTFLSGLGTVVAVYYLGKYIYGSSVGFIAGIFLAGSTYWVWLTTVYLNDPSMILAGTAGLLFLVRWIQTDTFRYYVYSAVAVALAVLLKLSALYLGIPIFFLWWSKFGRKCLNKPSFWIFGIVTLAPSLAWYLHAHLLYLEYGNTYGIVSGGLNKFSTVALLTNPDFYNRVVGDVIRYGLTPFVSVFFAIGLFRRLSWDIRHVAWVWSASVMFFFLVAGNAAYSGVQYLLCIIPAGALLAGESFIAVAQRPKIFRTGSPRTVALVLVAAALVFSANVAWSMRILPYLEPGQRNWRKAGAFVRGAIPPGSRIIVCTIHDIQDEVSSWKQLDTPPEVFYYSGHKGWYRSLRWLTPGYIDTCREEGASYLVFPTSSDTAIRNSPIFGFVQNHYRVLRSEPNCIIFDLQAGLKEDQ